MDFSLLDPEDLQEFLDLARTYNIPLNPYHSKVEQAEQLFDQLQNIPGVIFPLPIVDLYIASNYKGPRDTTYTI